MKMERNVVYYVNFDKMMVNDIEVMIKAGKRVKVKWYKDVKLWGVKEI